MSGAFNQLCHNTTECDMEGFEPPVGISFVHEGEHRHAYSSSPNFPDMHPICDSYTEVSESTESLAGGWIPAFRFTTYWNGGPVLRWRGPFFFLPTNPLHNAISSLFLGWLSHRHRGTQLATTFQLPLPAVAQGSSDMEFSISYTKLTSLRLLQQIHLSKFNESIIHHSLQIVKAFPCFPIDIIKS